ncbi:Nucleotidyltransferase domain protein, Caur_2868 group [hydrothermal vent metagenome]|uniref:Nucleotidyltransferase domain protein, Caur_2868 group n=1 Tax=hydrothermal vent metagenome TaxID=652676 RepID=A0A3B0W366_9ZZZZ
MSKNERLYGLTIKDIEKLQSIFKKYPQVNQVILYGSRAKGNYRPSSDIDLTLVGEIEWPDFQKIEIDLDDLLLPYQIDLSIMSHISNPELLKHIQRVGQPFYQQPNSSDTN